MLPSNLAELIQAAAKEEQARVAREIAEAQQKLLTMSYDKAASYTTVIIFGGYAGFFAIWQLTKDYLSKPQALWSALLILISLLAFVLFEVSKMIIVTRRVYSKAKALRDPSLRTNPHLLLKSLNELESAQHSGLGLFLVFWAISVAISVSGALGGATILSFAFISGLAK